MSSISKPHYDAIKYKTPTGTKLNCKGWIQEAALRMLLNNLNPEVAERPEELIVYGGRGKAARNFEALDNIIAALKILENDESLLIQSGKPVGILFGHRGQKIDWTLHAYHEGGLPVGKIVGAF